MKRMQNLRCVFKDPSFHVIRYIVIWFDKGPQTTESE